MFRKSQHKLRENDLTQIFVQTNFCKINEHKLSYFMYKRASEEVITMISYELADLIQLNCFYREFYGYHTKVGILFEYNNTKIQK